MNSLSILWLAILQAAAAAPAPPEGSGLLDMAGAQVLDMAGASITDPA